MLNKTLSVVMPNYNDADHIHISLKAICEQSFPPVEVIVIDNCSTDNSIAVIKEMITKYPFIRLLQNDTNRGCIYSCNRGAQLATGDYLYVATANDLVYPGFFEKSMHMLAQYPEVGVCFADSGSLVVKDGKDGNGGFYRWMPVGGYYSPQQLADMAGRSPATCVFAASPNTIMRRDLLPRDQLYIPEIDAFGDLFLSQVLVFRHGCCYVPEPLVVVRLMENGYSNRLMKDKARFQAICIRLIQLFASVEYEDITPLIIRSHLLRAMTFTMRTPFAVLIALYTMRKRNRHATALFLHLVAEYFHDLLNYPIATPTIAAIAGQSVKQDVHDACVRTYYFLKNICDRAYATTFHKYDRARSAVRKQLGL